MCYQNNNFVQDCNQRSKNHNFPGGHVPRPPLGGIGGTHIDACAGVLTHATTTFAITCPPPQHYETLVLVVVQY